MKNDSPIMKLFKSASIIAIVTLLSKVLGFLRDAIMASKFGSGYETDTYLVAQTASYLVVGVVGLALNTVLVPVFSEIDEKLGKKESVRFLNNTLNIVVLISIFVMVAMWFLSPYIISIVGKGYGSEQFLLAVKLNRIGIPITLGMMISFIFTGFLQSRERFLEPAAVGLPFNIAQILFLLFMSTIYGIEGMMASVVVGVFLQIIIQLPRAIKEGFKYKPIVDFKDKYLRKILYLILPVIFGTAIQQINVIIDRTLASELVEGSVSALNYASKINDTILGIFVMAITTVIFPMLSKAATRDDKKGLLSITRKGSLIILLITIPATVGIVILAEPLVKIFFERGKFDSRATMMTSQALIFYSVGLVGSAMRQLLTKVYYSIHDTKTPTINGAMAVGVNIVLNLILVKYMEHRGLALATSIAGILTSLMLLVGLNKRIKGFDIRLYITDFLKILLASSIMGVVVFVIYRNTMGILLGGSIVKSLLVLLVIVVIAIVIYINACYYLKVGRDKKAPRREIDE